MESDLLSLKIGESEIENLSGIEIIEIQNAHLYRNFNHKKFFNFSQIVLHQLLIFSLTLIITCPVSLIIVSKTNYDSNDPKLISLFFLITILFSFLLTIIWSVQIWFKLKSLLFLINLLEEVNKYNQTIDSIAIIDKFIDAGNLTVNLTDRKETIKALKLTRESLICAIKTEKIIRENQDIIAKQSELFLTIENNFSNLMNFQISNQVGEYSRSLNSALDIGINVQKEMLKLQNQITKN